MSSVLLLSNLKKNVIAKQSVFLSSKNARGVKTAKNSCSLRQLNLKVQKVAKFFMAQVSELQNWFKSKKPVSFTANPLNFFSLFSGGCCESTYIYSVIRIFFIGVAFLGSIGTVVVLLAAAPSAMIWTVLLSISGVIGAIITNRAASIAKKFEDMKVLSKHVAALNKETQGLKKQVQNFSAENTRLAAVNVDLEGGLQDFRNENFVLQGNNNSLAENNFALNESIAKLAGQNTQHQGLLSQLVEYANTCRIGNEEDRNNLLGVVEKLKEETVASARFWNEVLVIQVPLLSQLKTILNQMATKGTPQYIELVRGQCQELEKHVRDATEQLSDLRAKIAHLNGQIEERDQLFKDLKSAHREILASYGNENDAFGRTNELFVGQMERLKVFLTGLTDL